MTRARKNKFFGKYTLRFQEIFTVNFMEVKLSLLLRASLYFLSEQTLLASFSS